MGACEEETGTSGLMSSRCGPQPHQLVTSLSDLSSRRFRLFFRMMKQLRYGAARTQHPTYYNNVRCLQRYVSYLVSSFSSFKCRPVLFSLILLPLRLYRLLHIGTVMVAAAAAAASSLFIYSFFVSRGNLKDAAHSTFSFVYFFEKRRDEKGARDPKWPTLSFFLSPSRFRDNSLLPTRVFVVLI